MIRDLESTKLIWLKAILLLFIGFTAAALILLESPRWETALLLALTIWAFCRAYYFAFYVLEKYVDPIFRYRGIGSMLGYLWQKRLKEKKRQGSDPLLPPAPASRTMVGIMGAYPGRKQVRARAKRAAKNDRIIAKGQAKKAAAKK